MAAPWRDKAGRFAPLKGILFAALFLPGLWTALGGLRGALGAEPLRAALQDFGLWALRFLFLSLAISPLRQLLAAPRLIQLRRMLGVAAFAYAAAHLSLYAADQMFDLAKVASEIALRLYLAIGFAALLGLAALAATSTGGMMRRLGGKAWRHLHLLAYAIALLASLHFFMQSKAARGEAFVMAGLYLWLMLYRALARLYERRAPPLVPVALLGLAATAATALGEATYFRLQLGADPLRVLAADLSGVAGARPAWVVGGIALGIVLAAQLFSSSFPRPSPHRPSPQARRAAAEGKSIA